MELRGLASFIMWRYDDSGKLIVDATANNNGIFVVDLASSLGATQANITNMSTAPEKVYGSNAVAEQTVGVIQPSVALAANDIPHKTYDLYAGLQEDAVNGGMAAKSGLVTTGGLIIKSTDRTGKVDAYIAFPMGIYTAGELNLQTNQQNPTIVHDALTFSPQARASDQLVYQKFYSDDDKFDYEKMLTFIANGYVAKTAGA
jgi:hypothetical protein